MEFLAAALAARERDPGMAIAMRMAGLGWLDALARGAGSVAEYARVFGAVDAINYLSESSRALIEARAAEAGVPLAPRDSFVADIGVSASRVPAGWQGPGAGPGLEILVATRFSPPQKRQDLLVEAAALLRDRLPLRITMVGTGGAREALARRRDALGLQETIEMRPFMAQEELWAAMRRADLLCHPCEHEGVSKIILEAMMLGLPVLASDVPPLPDYVIEGETGWRVANTPEAWAAKLVELAAARDRLAGVAARARAFVEATYDMERNVGRYEAAFAALVAARGGPGTAGGTAGGTGAAHAQ
jgi:glycosyltransferase involved in cell wall biosynthesis